MTTICRKKMGTIASAVLLFILSGLPAANAATVRQVDFNELVAGSELVFHGRVESVRSRWDAETRAVFTDVDFQVFEVISGEASGRRVRLSFPAGRHGDIEVVVHGLRIPELNERGVYFIESTAVPMVNPIYGWSQGRFRVDAVDESESLRVFAADGSPVLSVDGRPRPTSGIAISRGTARGVQASATAPRESAMTLAEFSDVIRRTREAVQ